MIQSNRLSWPDTAKALGMLLVYWGHFIEAPSFGGYEQLHTIYKAIYSFHMPLFFILAGFFFREQNIRFGALWLQKFRTRLVPAVFFVTMALPLWAHSTWFGIEGENPFTTPVLLQNLAQGRPLANWTCWFLVCIFHVELISSELIPFLKKGWRVLLLLPLVFAFGFWITYPMGERAAYVGITEGWWILQEAFMALFFYLVGHFLPVYCRRILPGESSTTFSLVVMLVSLVLWQVTYTRNFAGSLGTVNMSGGIHGDWLLFVVPALAGSLFLMHAAFYLPAIRVLTYVGQNTLPLLGINGLFLHFFYKPMWTWCAASGAETTLIPLTLLVAILSLAASLPVVYVLNRFVPLLIGKWK